MSALTTYVGKLSWTDRAESVWRDVLALGLVGLLSVSVVALFLGEQHRLVGSLGMPLDDAWIHFRIAENLANGLGFSYNPGIPTSASTSPAWTALLAVVYRVTGQFIVPVMALGVCFALASDIAVYFIAMALRPDRRIALAAAVLAAVTGRWVWASLSGMETTLFTALTLWGILLLFLPDGRGRRGHTIAGAALISLAGLVRPEGFLLLAIALGMSLAPILRQARVAPRAELASGLLRSEALVLLIALVAAVALRMAYTLMTSGGLLGNTFTAQSLPQGSSGYTGPRLLPDLWYLRSAVESLRTDNFLLGLLIPLGMLSCLRSALCNPGVRSLVSACLLWFVALPLFYSVISPNLRHHERYLMPLIPLAVLFGILGIQFIVEQVLGDRLQFRIPSLKVSISAATLFIVIATLALGDSLFDTRRWAIQYGGDTRNIEAVNVRMGEWLRDNTPENAYLAVNDIGAIAFISDRRILDTVGIAEPEILPVLAKQGRQGVLTYLQARRPDYLVIWPEWYPELAARTDLFTPVYSVRMDEPVTAVRASMLGGREMVVYQAHWPQP